MAETIASFIEDYKTNTYDRIGNAKDLNKKWKAFLPANRGGKTFYKRKDVEFLLKRIYQKLGDDKDRLNKAKEIVAKGLGIGMDTIDKLKIRIKQGPGRPSNKIP